MGQVCLSGSVFWYFSESELAEFIFPVYLKRRAGDHFDKDGSFFLRLETDGLPTHDGPFIRAVNVDK